MVVSERSRVSSSGSGPGWSWSSTYFSRPAGQHPPDVRGPGAVPQAVQGVERGAGADVDRIRPEHGSNAHVDLVHAGLLELESSDTASRRAG